MLAELHVRNFALIDRADLEFRNGLNILTGETGAGKSILIDSITAALGGKAGKDLIRTGADSAYIELLFTVTGEECLSRLRSHGVTPEEDGTLILSRKIMKTRSVIRVNDEAVTAALAREIASALIDIHGQHEVQTLFRPETHLKYVDLLAPAELKSVKEAYRKDFARWSEIRLLLAREGDESVRARERDILSYEVREIRDADLKAGEEEELEGKFSVIRNAARIRDALGEAAEALSTDEISRAVRKVKEVAEYAPPLADLEGQLAELDSLLTDAERSARELCESFSFDEEALSEIGGRLDRIRTLEDKYGTDIPGILKLLGEKEERLSFLDSFDETREKLQKEKKELEGRLTDLSARITRLRKDTAAGLARRMREELSTLNFAAAEFEIRFGERDGFGPDGRDTAEFFLSTNPGEPLKPLRDIASGGELSRIMLAFKTVIADRDEIPTLIFDEIDAGISGRTAQMVSEKLTRIGRKRQVLCITHLPQIAAMADHHFLIEKRIEGNRSVTSVREIEGKEITEELARLIGGTRITDGVLQTAEEMKLLAVEKKSVL